MRSTLAAVALVAGSLALGSGIASAAQINAAQMQGGNAVYITTGPADRCQSFADDANRSLSTGDGAAAQQIVDSAQAQDCTLMLVVP
ncbi:hypothetical protein [Rhodococcoides kyotonense]|uniref:DUF4189 domain-containing protein n=1 Tax=Rhodococcoides kyotonense TaxID=398843 RepID=A0A239GKS3_9NOCA|nr:hypothetical protein [Rhodococcus kyotonensis]SNS69730.1 hypothetical protein SAMN05421642_104292 [Rhodococcus kyotonensis]